MDLFIKFLVAAVGAGTPLLFGTVGEILNEKVGHLNLGVEGMMAIGACARLHGGLPHRQLRPGPAGGLCRGRAQRPHLRGAHRHLPGEPRTWPA